MYSIHLATIAGNSIIVIAVYLNLFTIPLSHIKIFREINLRIYLD